MVTHLRVKPEGQIYGGTNRNLSREAARVRNLMRLIQLRAIKSCEQDHLIWLLSSKSRWLKYPDHRWAGWEGDGTDARVVYLFSIVTERPIVPGEVEDHGIQVISTIYMGWYPCHHAIVEIETLFLDLSWSGGATQHPQRTFGVDYVLRGARNEWRGYPRPSHHLIPT